ncbi:MAG: hypothetical protein ACI8W8_002155, partial [Rhodothermales bacterium]
LQLGLPFAGKIGRRLASGPHSMAVGRRLRVARATSCAKRLVQCALMYYHRGPGQPWDARPSESSLGHRGSRKYQRSFRPLPAAVSLRSAPEIGASLAPPRPQLLALWQPACGRLARLLSGGESVPSGCLIVYDDDDSLCVCPQARSEEAVSRSRILQNRACGGKKRLIPLRWRDDDPPCMPKHRRK